jgi:hypothetical protein
MESGRSGSGAHAIGSVADNSPSGATVAEAIEKLGIISDSDPCKQKTSSFDPEFLVPIFLSAAPVNHPDYEGLLVRTYKGLTHLDGLHHLVLWGQVAKPEITAFLAVRA